MRSVLHFFAWSLGFDKQSEGESEDDEPQYWGVDPRKEAIREQLEYYFSGANLEQDKNMRAEIEKNEAQAISVDYFLRCNRLKQLGATAEEILDAARDSEYLEAHEQTRSICPQTKFVSDPHRAERTLRVTGIAADVPWREQCVFFKSLFPPGEVVHVSLIRRFENGELVYTGTAIVELNSIEEADRAVFNGIQYGKGELEVVRMSDYQKQVQEEKAQSPNKSPRSPRRTKQ